MSNYDPLNFDAFASTFNADIGSKAPALIKSRLRQRIASLKATARDLLPKSAESVPESAASSTANLSSSNASVVSVLGPDIVGTNGSETLTGTANDEEILGLGGNDLIEGLAGNDSLFGGAGNDTVQGGIGNDTNTILDFDDLDFFDGGAGVDHLILAPTNFRNFVVNVPSGFVGDASIGGQQFVNVERFTTSRGNDEIIGDNANNIFQGGAGNDTLRGGAGDDTSIITDFNDIDFFDGGAGVDHLLLTPPDNRNLFVNVAGGFVGDGRVGGQQFVNVERFTTGNGNDTILGDAANNIFQGGAGNDTLQGGAGNDSLSGGAGRDRFVFDALNDLGDTITDFSVGTDSLQINAVNLGGGLQAGALTASQFVQGAVATKGSDRFLYNATNGQLLFDADGTGTTAAIRVATFTNTPTLSASDIAIQGSAPLVSSFDIDINFTDSSLSASQRAIFTNAAARWSEIIVEDIPDVSISGFGLVDDVVIDALAVDIDGAGGSNGNVLGQAGPTRLRNGSLLPARGMMEFDRFDVDRLEASGRLEDVILHEMGHVLGIGTIWGNLDLVTGQGGSDPRFLGAQATAEYNSLFGVNEGSVPVANVGGTGTRDAHWRESTFGNELMTGQINSGINPISRVTIGSLADLGYTVNLGAADPYTPPSSLVALSSGQDETPSLGNLTADLEGEFMRAAVQVLPA
ncbi:MAG: leishmanolysin-related zinc metalloendopeptidase [Thermosynechococcaceae cyanobacterium]